MLLKTYYDFFSSNFITNVISFGSFLVAIIALAIGGEKVTEVLEEYKKKKRIAVFSYHTNMRIFIMRLKYMVTDSQGKPTKTLYLYSSDMLIRKKGLGYKKMAEKLVDLSQKVLDYLSTESDQIPASSNGTDILAINDWADVVDKLIEYLSDFLLYGTESYLPDFDDENSIIRYHADLIKTLNEMLTLIDRSKEELKNEMKK